MAAIITKRGSQDNIITYEHICDTIEDMNHIEPRYTTLGSTCIVLSGQSGELEVYIANSEKQWITLSMASSEDTNNLSIHVCTPEEVNSQGIPIINEPDAATLYFVISTNNTDNNLYSEYIYLDNSWEKIGDATLSIDNLATQNNPSFTGNITLGNTSINETELINLLEFAHIPDAQGVSF